MINFIPDPKVGVPFSSGLFGQAVTLLGDILQWVSFLTLYHILDKTSYFPLSSPGILIPKTLRISSINPYEVIH
jgi:hypothetical protein